MPSKFRNKNDYTKHISEIFEQEYQIEKLMTETFSKTDFYFDEIYPLCATIVILVSSNKGPFKQSSVVVVRFFRKDCHEVLECQGIIRNIIFENKAIRLVVDINVTVPSPEGRD